MSKKGNNALQENFFGHMKDEINVSKCKKFNEVKAIIDDWLDYYNNERYQWHLAKLSPNEYYNYIKTGIYPLSNLKNVLDKGDSSFLFPKYFSLFYIFWQYLAS